MPAPDRRPRSLAYVRHAPCVLAQLGLRAHAGSAAITRNAHETPCVNPRARESCSERCGGWARRACGPASSARARDSTRGRGCESRGGGRSHERERAGRRREPRDASVGCCRRGRHVVSQALVAGPAEGNDAVLAGLDRDGGLAGVGGERVVGRVAGAVVADLGEQAGGGHDALAVAEEGKEDRLRRDELRMAPAIWLVSWLICSTIGRSAAIRPITAVRRASCSSSPTTATGALRSLSSSSAGVRRPQ